MLYYRHREELEHTEEDKLEEYKMKTLIDSIDALPQLMKLILALPGVDIVWWIYRICRSLDKNAAGAGARHRRAVHVAHRHHHRTHEEYGVVVRLTEAHRSLPRDNVLSKGGGPRSGERSRG